MPSLANVQQVLQLIAVLVLAFVGVTKALAALFGFVGAFWAPALKAAAWCNTASKDLHLVGAKLGSFFPMSAARQAAKRAARSAPLVAGLFLIGAIISGGCASWLQANPAVAPASEACGSCVGVDAIANETAAAPLPFYPQFCEKLVSDCGKQCGTAFIDVISGLASSTDPSVTSTKAFNEASARKSAMLAPSADR